MKNIEERIRKLEEDIMKLKAAYDQYLTGVERRPPDQLAEKVAREVRTLTSTNITNTAQRFKTQQVISRYNTYLQFWQRNLRELEEGRKPKRRVIQAAAAPPEEGVGGVYEVSTTDIDGSEMDELFSAVALEYQRLGNGKTPDMEKVRQALVQRVKAVRERYGSEKALFKVVKEGDKVTIKAGPADRRKS